MIWIYRFGYGFLWCFLWVGALFSLKLRKGLVGRVGLSGRLKKVTQSWETSSPRLWFHVSSAGELEQVFPLLDRLKARFPQTYLTLTFFSSSAEKALRNEIQRRQNHALSCSWDYADYSVWDFPWTLRSFLRTLKPKAAFFVHRELWPETLVQCQTRDIPSFLLGAFLPQEKPLTFWDRFTLKFLKGIATVDLSSKDSLNKVFSGEVVVLGDPRNERVLDRKEKFSKRQPWGSFFEGRRIFVGASLWDEDFKVLKDALVSLTNTHPELCLFLVPHEPTPKRVEGWIQSLKTKGVTLRKWSHWTHSPDMTSHLIVDEVGLLAELYALSTFVFVGGSFKKRIHNVLEPLAHGATLFSGPLIGNSLEAQELSQNNLLKIVHTTREFEEALEKALQKDSSETPLEEPRHRFLESRKGISDCYLAKISDWAAL